MSCEKCWRWHFQDPKLKIFWGSMPPEPPRLDHLLHYNFSFPCEHIFKISCYASALWFNLSAILLISQIHNLILLHTIYIYLVIVCHFRCWCKPKQSALDRALQHRKILSVCPCSNTICSEIGYSAKKNLNSSLSFGHAALIFPLCGETTCLS